MATLDAVAAHPRADHPPRLADFHRIVIKVGSSLLVDADGVRRDWLSSLAMGIAALQTRGAEVLVVSSGSIALGRRVLGLPSGALKQPIDSGNSIFGSHRITPGKKIANAIAALMMTPNGWRASQSTKATTGTGRRHTRANAHTPSAAHADRIS